MIHQFCTHLPQLTYVTAEGKCIVITGTLLLDSDQHSELISELTAIAEDPGSPIFIPATQSEAVTSEAEETTQKALQQELLTKAAVATVAAAKSR